MVGYWARAGECCESLCISATPATPAASRCMPDVLLFAASSRLAPPEKFAGGARRASNQDLANEHSLRTSLSDQVVRQIADRCSRLRVFRDTFDRSRFRVSGVPHRFPAAHQIGDRKSTRL